MYEVEPEWIWWNGAVVPWRQARVHVGSETALRGLNVFEGVRGYWNDDHRRWAVVRLDDHLRRLVTSAQLMRIPVRAGLYERMRGAVVALLDRAQPSADVYLRPTIYVDAGRYRAADDELTVGEFIACHRADPTDPSPIRCMISQWRRVPDAALPTAAKTGAAYSAFRLARLQALDAGADEAILLGTHGGVTETPGASVFAVLHGSLVTAPLTDGLLDSITRATVIELAHKFGIPFYEQSLTAVDLLAAQEVFLAGTLDEVRAVREIDGCTIPVGPITTRLRDAYLAMCRGAEDSLFTRFVQVLP
ncbi:hypothetical protein HLB23_40420 [Nocardia uniformis]|uniref:Branched-chain-amino-acid transaminase n=1 Tax=Nocardia uniformis TaxID=53432 RepID=A0A849CGK6_9NOCA|nr:aminotransferase class IV [Nocardia uniformis]NNH76045.1 hypothetical protein [Nocardia uniformis]